MHSKYNNILDGEWWVSGGIVQVRVGCNSPTRSRPKFSDRTIAHEESYRNNPNMYCIGHVLRSAAFARNYNWILVSDLSLEDNGNYTCLISGPHNTVLASVTHYIFVRGEFSCDWILDSTKCELVHTVLQNKWTIQVVHWHQQAHQFWGWPRFVFRHR